MAKPLKQDIVFVVKANSYVGDAVAFVEAVTNELQLVNLNGPMVGAVAYGPEAWMVSPLTIDASALLTALQAVNPISGTDWEPAHGIKKARWMMQEHSDRVGDASRVMVILANDPGGNTDLSYQAFAFKNDDGGRFVYAPPGPGNWGLFDAYLEDPSVQLIQLAGYSTAADAVPAFMDVLAWIG